MARLLTLLAAAALIAAALRGSPLPPAVPEAPDGLALTPLTVRMTADGSTRIQGWPRDVCETATLGGVMRTARLALPAEALEALEREGLQPMEELFFGWLRVRVDPNTPFVQVWRFFMDPDRDDEIYRFAFDATDGGAPLFVEMPWDWGLQCGPDAEGDLPVWLIQNAGSRESRSLFGTQSETSSSDLGEGDSGSVRHALGRYMGDRTMTVGAYYDSVAAAMGARGGVQPHLVVEAGVPWKEVEPVLRGLAVDGLSWWPVLAERISTIS